MKKTLSIISVMLVAMCFGASRASAQGTTFQSGYFLDNFAYGYRLNPAIMSEKGFMGFGVGNIDAGLSSDIGVSTLLFPNADGTGLVTGLHSSVSKEDFLAGIHDSNNIGLDAGVNIFSAGRRKENSMGTFEINLRADAGLGLPGDFFRFLKCGSSESAYDLSNLSIGAKAYAEVAIGRAFTSKNEKMNIGFRIKGLVGLANANVNLTTATLTTNADEIAVNVDGAGRVACAPVSLGTDADGNLTYAIDQTQLRPSGYGAAVDLGLKMYLTKNLTLTAGINDLGGISWTYNALAKSKGSASFKGFSDVDADTNFQEQLDGIVEDLKKIANLTPVDGTESSFEMLSYTANAGLRYRLPLIRRLSVGALGTYHFDSVAPWYDARVGATFTPLNWLSVTANYGQNSRGTVCGAAASVSLLFLNAFVGVDAYAGRISMYPMEGLPAGLTGIPFPIDPFRYKVNVGVTMQMGKRYSDLKRRRNTAPAAEVVVE